MSRQLIYVVLVLLAAAGLTFGMIAMRPEPEEQEPVVSVPLVETEAYAVNAGALEILGTGTVQAREEVSLGAEISGRLVWVNPDFREGGFVGQGEALFRIDPSDYRNRVRSAQADVAAQDVAVLQASEEVAIAQAELERFATREATRSGNTGNAQILPPQDMAGQSSASSAAESANPNILATREPQLRSAQAAQERAAANLADAQLALSRTSVRSPFAGLVRSEDASVGTLVQPGQALGSVVATNAFEVRVSLSEAEAALIPGLFATNGANIPATVEMEYGGRQWRWNAVVDRADPILSPETRTIDVFLRVTNPLRGGVAVGEGEAGAAPPLLLGSFVSASITGGASQPYAIIPLEALREGNTVWLLAQGKLRIVPVEVIQRTDRLAFVAGDGLGQGGNVITSTLRTPVDGMELRGDAAQPAPALEPAPVPEGDDAGE